jgi:protein gp37
VATTIEWTQETWNPVHGCDRVSPGCDRCYALKMAKRLKAMGRPDYQRDGDPRTSGPGFAVQAPVNMLLQPLRWKRPRRIFVDSMGDVFHAAVEDTTIARIFAVMAATPHHTYQLLTKRPARMRSLLTSAGFHAEVALALIALPALAHSPAALISRELAPGRSRPMEPLPNLWLGTSVENQQWAENRIPLLLQTPAAVRWISAEPLLGPIDLKAAVRTMGSERGHGLTASYVHTRGCCAKFHGLDWVVAGGESGPGARPMDPAWARGLRDQCTAADIPFLFKQWGAWAPTGYQVIGTPTWHKNAVLVGDPVDDLGHRTEMHRIGKKAAGRELDGRTWDQYPDPPTQP